MKMETNNYKQGADDHLFSNNVSKESSISNPSFRIYYGGLSGSVPFMWESQPGTPKHNFSDNFIPPLTPPPSYYTNNNHLNTKRITSRSIFSFHSLMLRLSFRKRHISSPTSSLSSSSTLSSLQTPSSMRRSSSTGYRRRRLLSVGSSLDGFEDEKMNEGCYSSIIVKRALLSMVCRHGSA